MAGEDVARRRLGAPTKLLGLIHRTLLYALLAFLVISLPIVLHLFFFGKLSDVYTPESFSEVFRIFAFAQAFTMPLKLNFTIAFLSFWAINSILLALLFLLGLKKVNVNQESSLPLVVSDNFAFTSLVLALVRLAMESAFGKVPSSNLDPFQAMVQSIIAPVREELGYRLSLIGVAAVFVTYRKGRISGIARILWRPGSVAEGSSKVIIVLWAVNIISAVLFGLGHLPPNQPPWTSVRVAEATISGLVLGYVYMRYGFHASVSLHLCFNYLPLFAYLPRFIDLETIISYLLLIAGMMSIYRRIDDVISRAPSRPRVHLAGT